MKRLIIAVSFIIFSFPVIAAPITYTYISKSSGSLGGILFTNQSITIVGAGDTNKIVSTYNGGLLQNELTSLFVTVSDVGSAAFSGFNSIFSTDLGPALSVNGKVVGAGFDFLDGERFDGANYDLKSNFGPRQLSLICGGGEVSTTAGLLILPCSSSTFTFIALVPEPSSLATLGLGTLLLLGYRKLKSVI